MANINLRNFIKHLLHIPACQILYCDPQQKSKVIHKHFIHTTFPHHPHHPHLSQEQLTTFPHHHQTGYLEAGNHSNYNYFDDKFKSPIALASPRSFMFSGCFPWTLFSHASTHSWNLKQLVRWSFVIPATCMNA